MSEKGKKRNVVSKMIKIDGEMLRRAIYDRDLVPMNMSKEIGMNNSYVSHCIGEGSISPGSARMLEVMFGIKPEEYFWKEPEPEPEPVKEMDQMCLSGMLEEAKTCKEEFIQSDEFWKTLKMVITSAVYEAVSRTYNEPWKNETGAANAGN